MATSDDLQEQEAEEMDRRQSAFDWMALLGLVATLCIGFVLLVAAGYGIRALLRAFS
ncbi:hypothetical protein ACFPOE_13345 [Caenimonas terrae]|uniref:Uncharacterized protein n=1 Tax=Caenimonas terrae TaxID=696074 RepID=A0ABW0NDB9_9BURK